MCLIATADSPEFYKRRTRNAHRPHKCCECARKIRAGEQYEYVSGVYDGMWFTAKTCVHCVAARSWLVEMCDGAVHGGVLEDLEEHWNEHVGYHSMWLGRAIIGMRSKWRGLPVLNEFAREAPRA